MIAQVRPRSEIPVQYTWDTASIFPSDQAWEAEMEQVIVQLSELAAYRGRLGDGPETLADWMESVQGLLRSLGKISVYASNNHNVDTTDQAGTAQYDRAMGLYARAMAAIAFAEPELLAIDTENGSVVGFITAISDGVLCAYLPLLEVLPECQKQGVGSELMRRMMAKLDGLYMIDLVRAENLGPFYERFGLIPADAMVIRNFARQSGR